MKRISKIIPKIIVVFIVLFAVIYSVYNIKENNKKVSKESYYTDKKDDVNIEFTTIEELRKDYLDNISDVKDGVYENLTTNNPYVYITKENTISEIKEKSNTRYKDKSRLELLEEEYKIVKELIGDNLNMDNLVDDTSWYYINDNYDLHYPTYEETIESIKNGTYTPNELVATTYPKLAYVGAPRGGKDRMYCHVPPDMHSVVFMKGGLFKLMNTVIDDLETEYTPVKIYYKNSSDLDDEYQLSNGKMSVGDGIEFVENYFANKYPYNINKDIKEKVYFVDVFDIGNGLYAYEFGITKEFAGLIGEVGYILEGASIANKYDTRAIMVETNDVDMRIGLGNGNEMEKIGEEFSKVVSLKSAFQLISEKIGKNSKYEVKEIAMIFKRKILNGTIYQEDIKGIPTWLIRCENKADGMETRFYINLNNGKLDYEKRSS